MRTGSRGTGGDRELNHHSFPKDVRVGVFCPTKKSEFSKKGLQHVAHICSIQPLSGVFYGALSPPQTFQLSHGSLWGFTSEVFLGGCALGAPRRHLPLHLSGMHEGSMGSVSLVQSFCDINPFSGGGQAGSPVLSEVPLTAALAGASDWEVESKKYTLSEFHGQKS